MTTELEVIPGSLAIADDSQIRRLVAAWLLGYESQNTRRNYSLDLAAWLDFCDRHGLGPLRARQAHVDAWARSERRPLSGRTSVVVPLRPDQAVAAATSA